LHKILGGLLLGMPKEKISAIIILAFSMLMFFAFGFYHIGKFATADEHYWIYERIPQYFKALGDWNFKKTRINDKPGVSLALVSGIGLLQEKNPQSHFEKVERIDRYDSANSEHFYSNFRLPLIIFNLFIAAYLFWVIERILKNRLLSALAVSFIILSPVIIGTSRIINPDALLWSTSAAALISFFVFTKTDEKKFIFLTGFFTGLALLSKYSANILFIFYFIFILTEYLINYKRTFSSDSYKSSAYFNKNIFWLAVIFFFSCLVLGFLMPAALRNPKIMYLQTLGSEGIKKIALPFILIVFLFFLDAAIFKAKIISRLGIFFEKIKRFIIPIFYGFLLFLFFAVLANWIFNLNIFDTAKISVDARSTDAFVLDTHLGGKILLETYPLVFSLTPLVLGLIIFYWTNKIFGKKEEDDCDSLGLSISIFLLIFLSGGIISGVLLTARYLVLLYPLAGFLAILGIREIFKKFNFSLNSEIIISFLILIISFLTLWSIKPFYYNYASFLLPKNLIVSDAWGFGGYEAADYLNNLPDSKNLTIWADYYGTCEFFKGNCSTDYKFDKPVDYYVLTRRGEIRYEPVYWSSKSPDWNKGKIIEAYPFYSSKNPVWQLNINSRPGNFIKIFKAER
jgi:hypothetical protein